MNNASFMLMLAALIPVCSYAEEVKSSQPITQTTTEENSTIAAPVTPYLMKGAPTFDLTLEQFRTKYNSAYPELQIGEYHIVASKDGDIPIIREASKINEQLYSSAALDKASKRIKSLQLTYISTRAEGEEEAHKKAIKYMAAVVNLFEPTFPLEQSNAKVLSLLAKGKGTPFYQQIEGALRYIVVDSGEKGITFAIEPIKLSLSDKP